MSKRSNGEGTIYKRKNGTWCASYYIAMPQGKKRKSVYGKTQKEVREKLKKAQRDAEQQSVMNDRKITLSDWVEIWLKDYKVNNLKITTYQNYEINYEKHIKESTIGKKNLDTLSAKDFQKFYNEKKKTLSSRTVRYLHTIINGAMKQAMKEHLINENVNEAVELPKKEKKEISVMTVDEMKRLLELFKESSYYALFLLEMQTGLRKGEILGLHWEDIDFENGKMHVRHNLCRITGEDGKAKLVLMEPKTLTSKRSIPLTTGMLEVLKKHKAEQDADIVRIGEAYHEQGIVFSDALGEYISPRKLLQVFQDTLKKAGLPRYRFHDLRHSFASILLQEGESVKVIQELLGHSMISTTLDIYTHTSEAMKREGINELSEMLM